ncbi:hypothetical protein LSH36_14g06006 [Paralvinella palmiformis]|uniref:Uncharacterized protein n=1 Tax=Paralvinella palmiformis TaxID=53620 RepID=A0AAD9NHI3_9ANNE|nr:hypothetical protein LSH36_14g06006 [Paralvinella palmiformis]
MDQSKRIDTGRKVRRGDKNKKWSEFLSPEARVAMQLALEDTKAMKLASDAHDGQPNDAGVKPTRVAFTDRTRQNEHEDTSPLDLSREPSYTELYERNGSSRMHRDMTDESYGEESDPKRALGGGKVESAMEIIEIVNHDDPETGNSLDDRAIEELAKINSVDKCTVWIEATQVHQKEQLPNIPEADHERRETGSS